MSVSLARQQAVRLIIPADTQAVSSARDLRLEGIQNTSR